MRPSPSRGRSWLASFRSRPVTLFSPHSGSECLRRLALVTTTRGETSWYLDPRTAGRPEPRLRGNVGPSGLFVTRLSVARWKHAGGSFAAWLDARLEPAAGEGTRLQGTIGLGPAARTVISLNALVYALMAVAACSGGIALVVQGHPGAVALAVLAPIGLAALFAGFSVAGLRSLERDIPKLIGEINGLLDSSATSPGACVY